MAREHEYVRQKSERPTGGACDTPAVLNVDVSEAVIWMIALSPVLLVVALWIWAVRRRSATITNRTNALHTAHLGGDGDDMQAAIEDGSDVDARDHVGRTALHYAAGDGRLDSVRALITAGADVDAADSRGEVPLQFAARSWNLPIAEALIAAGAVVDAANEHGNTPLSTAVFESRGRGELIRLLLGAGADPDRKNRHGVSPRSLAHTIANYPVAQFFT
jgi:ankyrin repeat protein